MDDLVKAALRKWPHVPHCHDWLALCARGHWYMRDDRVQAAGPFPQVKGSRITHDKLLAFIHRNYAADEQGAWYFQNGPQRVYVTLEAAPFVWRLHTHPGDGRLQATAQTQVAAEPQALWLDENGRAFLATDLGFGLVHSLDTGVLMEALGGALEEALEKALGDAAHEGRSEKLSASPALSPSLATRSGQALAIKLMRFDEMPARFGYVLHPALPIAARPE